jgi:hypothetical protein
MRRSGTLPPDTPRKFRFAVIPKALDIPVFDYAKKGAERRPGSLGTSMSSGADRRPGISSSRRRSSRRSSPNASTASRFPV